MTTGAKTLRIKVSLGFSWLVAPMNEKTKARGTLPVAKEAKNNREGILESPAMHATTSGITGSHLDKTTSHAPVFSKIISLCSNAFGPAILTATFLPYFTHKT